MNEHTRQTSPFRWEGIEVRPYKEEGTHFSGVSKIFSPVDGSRKMTSFARIVPASGFWRISEKT